MPRGIDRIAAAIGAAAVAVLQMVLTVALMLLARAWLPRLPVTDAGIALAALVSGAGVFAFAWRIR